MTAVEFDVTQDHWTITGSYAAADNIVIYHHGEFYRTLTYPGYKIWNIPVHLDEWVEMLEQEIARDTAQALTKTVFSTTDAAVWAREFVALFPQADEGTMLSWFASAIEVGRTAGQGALAERNATIAHLQAMLKARLCNCAGPFPTGHAHEPRCRALGDAS